MGTRFTASSRFADLGLQIISISHACPCVERGVTLSGAKKGDPTFCSRKVCNMALLNGVSLPSTETRADRSKKLFRHYTVGSYDSFDAAR